MYDIHAGKTHIHILKNLFLRLKRKRSPRRQQKGQAQRWERSQNLGGRMTKGIGYPWGPLHPRSHSLQPVPTSEKPQKCKKTDTTMGGLPSKASPRSSHSCSWGRGLERSLNHRHHRRADFGCELLGRCVMPVGCVQGGSPAWVSLGMKWRKWVYIWYDANQTAQQTMRDSEMRPSPRV